MEKSHFKTITKLIIFSIFTSLLSDNLCLANDSLVDGGFLCGPGADASTWTTTLQSNLNKVFDTLASNINQTNGFYKAEAGRGPEKMYGLVQCRGDISPNDCANCTIHSIKIASENCYKSKKTAIWSTWCYLRYSNESFYGEWEKITVEISGSNRTESDGVAAKGLTMMGSLASTAPNEALMFKTSVLDVGTEGKRYGMAQCSRDLSKSACGDCLDNQMKFLGSINGNKRRWEIYSLGCFMWYDDYQFYFNYTVLLPAKPGKFSGMASQAPQRGGVLSAAAIFLVVAISQLIHF